MLTISLIFIGFVSGLIVSGGAVGLLTGLSIIPRYANITHTQKYIHLYEDMIFWGIFGGNIFSLFPVTIHFPAFFMIFFGIFFGIFLGSWIMALAEISQVFPIFFKRIQLSQGFSIIIFSIAIGKSIGSIIYFFSGWY